ncbi:cytochrome-c peroxidase [Methyloprofundus sedimenti]|uniref:cytochrome-c peroxidase n=1 Tax=Methyloprofundus sedimenti TaxID=1420851 RepID=UPI001E37B1CD|nr:cytochrome c peroxidase [Methyloprofundus sedimenti]
MNTSCATCHHPLAGTGDGLALSVGEGGGGLGVTRDTGTGNDTIHDRVPRNAPHLFNLGAKQFITMFHDGRVTANPAHPSGFDSPDGDNLLSGLDHSLAVQAMFPPTSATEMAGQAGENSVADAAAAGDVVEVWRLLTSRVIAIPEYRDLIIQAYPDISENNIDTDATFVHIANAIGAFEATAFRADNSPYDRYLRGEIQFSQSQRMGYKIFTGYGNCSSCHSGLLQTDYDFHALGIPQIGTGKGDGINGLDDFGREQVTGDSADRYRFRTPTLRNVALTGLWGHNGAYDTLEAMVNHHLNPVDSLNNYDFSQARLAYNIDLSPLDSIVYNDQDSRTALAGAIEISPVQLSPEDVRFFLIF